MHDFVLFDGGVKKLPRVHQYFSVKAAQAHVHRREGGIIWHTQGSGKSIVMVLLARWILETNPNARVVIVTDRDELDKQIAGVFHEVGEAITRTSSGRDLMTRLGQATPRLLCTLVHKFGRKGVSNFEQFIKELEAQPCQTVPSLPAWIAHLVRRRKAETDRARSPKTIRLTEKILQELGTDRKLNPGIELEEAAWRYLLEKATAGERAKLHGLKPAEKAQHIQTVIESWTQTYEEGRTES